LINFLRHNFGLKLLALLLAIAAWGFTRYLDPIEEWQMSFDVDVRLRDGTSLVNRFPPTPNVTAYVSGPVSRLERLRASNMKVILDSRDLVPGETRTVSPRLERRFPGVSVELSPPGFSITVDETSRMDFLPEEVGEGALQPGYFIDERIGLPTSVTVDGAESLVSSVDRVVYRLSYEELTGSAELNVEFTPIDADGHDIANLNLIPPSADLGLSIRPSQALKTVPVVVDYQGTPASNYAMSSLSSNPFMVDLAGPAEILANIMSVRTSPINLTGKISSFEDSVSLIPPSEGVSLSVPSVTVQVAIEQIDTTFTFEGILIDLRGSDNAFIYEMSVPRADVTIRGGPARIAVVTSDLIRPQVDVSGFGPGSYEIPVSVALPSEVRRDRINPSVITVTITERPEPVVEPEPVPEDDEPADEPDPVPESPDSETG